MAIYTPRGLKVRIDVQYAFALMARLYPDVDAFKVLKTTEGLESMPSSLSWVVGILCFGFRLEFSYIALLVLSSYIIFSLINLKGLYIIPGIVGLSTLSSYFSGFGFFLIIASVVGYFLVGWQGVLAFLSGMILGWVVSLIFDFIETKKIHRTSGMLITASERHFFNAYRLHASRLGKTTDIQVSDDEMEEDNWQPVLADLAVKWPAVVARFTEE